MEGRVLVAATRGNETSGELVSVWRELGIDAELIPPTQLHDRLTAGDTVLARLDVLRTLDGVEPGLYQVLRAERRAYTVLNRVDALLVTHDKLRTARRLGAAGLPHPGVNHLQSGAELPRLEFPVVVKPRFGSWGREVVRCRTAAELANHLGEIRSTSWYRRHGALIQELVPPRGYDVRVIVAGGRAVGAVERVAAPGEWRTNISLGGLRRASVPSSDASALAVAAAAAAGADLVGVDLLPTDTGWVVIELNGAVEFDGYYSYPGTDVYASIADALGLHVVPKAAAP